MAEAGAAGAGNSNGGNGGAGGTGSEGSAGGAGNTDWTSGLSEDNRSFVTSKGWKDLNAVLTSHREAERKISSKGQHRLGDYSFTEPTNAKDIGYQPAFAESLKQVAHKLGVDPTAAAGIHDWFADYAGKSLKTAGELSAANLQKAITTAEGDLSTAWKADTNNPVFKRNSELATRAMKQLGLDGEALGILAKNGDKLSVVNGKAYAALAKVGNAMFAEDSLFGNSAGDRNPFDPKTIDTRAQSQLVQEDPDRAEQLIRALPKEEQTMWSMFLEKQAKRRAGGR